ncbi:hypothetical protein OQH61_07680 [Helicobacter sp. MIT 21-1697]|uniref:hypothetical protein n=1 Tax=Helicobacter sp. MIT 21-1697 TaxID=2993733 RepID=UPI00224AE6D6|nr:hypothetical protein [Helicobacter sp. MIT 21-1697]MCX2717611.1 hypothetical protein [Helicobacter sp. MIT 21-1697]
MRIVLALALMLCNVCAYTCYSTHCEDIRVGLGAHHSKTYNTGVYLSGYAAYHKGIFYIAGGVIIGQVSPTLTPTTDLNTYNQNDTSLFTAITPHIGVKLGGENPLFVYIQAQWERYGIGEYNDTSLNVSQLFIGPAMAYYANISDSIVLEVGVGMGANILRDYINESVNKGFERETSHIDRSYRVDTFLGMRFKRGETYHKKSDIYVRLNAIAYHNATTSTLPPRRDYAFMLECGISLENLLG